MPKIKMGGLLPLAFLLSCSIALAQNDDDAVGYAYSTYFTCNSADLGVADEIAKNVWASTYDAAVEAGDISAWGWMAHHTGGTWRRALYYVAPSMEVLLDAGDSIGAKLDENAPEAGRVFGEACPSHEDYIWQSVPGSGGRTLSGERGAAGLSVYFKCDSDKEERADEIVAKTFGPSHQKQVDAGNLTSWGWLQHNIGGDYRRLLTLTAVDHKTLIKARDAIFEEITSGPNERLSNEFDSICGPHRDYLWDLQIETP
jgi:hypothetical protein